MFEVALRTALILALTWILARVLSRAAAATRHLVWHCGIVAVLVAPFIGPLAPEFSVPRVPMVLERLSGEGSSPAMTASPNDTTASASIGLSSNGASSRVDFRSAVTFETVFIAGWLLGSGIFASWFVLGWICVAITAHRARRAPADWQIETNAMRERLQIDGEVDVRMIDRHISPVVIGLWQPTIVLPAIAHTWSSDCRRSVLLHELAHLQRHDLRVQAVTQTACAAYWFNPLIWVASRRLRSERERACDDVVLQNGAQPSAYAAHLLDIARELRPTLLPSSALAMARPSELEGRLFAVLATRRARVSRRGARWAIVGTVLVATVAVLGARPTTFSDAGEARLPVLTPSPHGLWAAMQDPVQPDTPVLKTIRPLEAALDDTDQDVREKAAMQLALISSADAVPGLLKALGDPDSQVREKAAIGLAFRRDPRVLDALIGAMKDPDSQVREKAAIALGSSGDARAIAPLERALQDSDAQVREKAVTGLFLLRSGAGDAAYGDRVRDGLRGLLKFVGL